MKYQSALLSLISFSFLSLLSPTLLHATEGVSLTNCPIATNGYNGYNIFYPPASCGNANSFDYHIETAAYWQLIHQSSVNEITLRTNYGVELYHKSVNTQINNNGHIEMYIVLHNPQHPNPPIKLRAFDFIGGNMSVVSTLQGQIIYDKIFFPSNPNEPSGLFEYHIPLDGLNEVEILTILFQEPLMSFYEFSVRKQ